MTRPRLLAALAACLLATACTSRSADRFDAGFATTDGAPPPDDGGTASPDAGRPGGDAGHAPGHDGGPPASDAGPRASDAGHSGHDAGPPDAGGDGFCDEATAGCAALAGSYGEAYGIYTAERLGGSIINDMRCTGSASIEIDPAARPGVTGTVECDYAGGLTRFGSHQEGTIEANVRADGTVEGTLVHQFDPSDSSTRERFSFEGGVTDGHLEVTGDGSWYPHPSAAVAWDVDFAVGPTD